MKLYVSFKKRPFSREELAVFADGALLGVVRSGREECFSLADGEHYFLQLGDKVTAEATVLVREGDEVHIAVRRQRRMLSLDVSGGVLRTFPIGRMLHALNDEAAVGCLLPWEKNAYFAMLYAELEREDAILESPYVLDVCDALIAVGDTEVGERLREAVMRCELTLPLSPLAKLTPAEESALVESYHLLWTKQEAAPAGERERSYRAVMEYIYRHEREADFI